jgi:hypothetical protein
MQITEDIRKKVLVFQQTEITEYHIYKRLVQRIKSPENAKILDQIADDELRHYNGWKEYTNEGVQAVQSWLKTYRKSIHKVQQITLYYKRRNHDSCSKEYRQYNLLYRRRELLHVSYGQFQVRRFIHLRLYGFGHCQEVWFFLGRIRKHQRPGGDGC